MFLQSDGNQSNGKMFPEKAENVCKAKLFFKTLTGQGLQQGRENWEKARKIYRRKKREGMKFGLVLIYVSWQRNP